MLAYLSVILLALLVGGTIALPSQIIFDPPNRNEQDNYSNRVFNSVWGLLRSIHQSQHPNGRAVVPGLIRKGTLLYHGRSAGPPATGIDWFAFDAEHSYMFASHGAGGGTLWTYSATRDLKILYFDGFSASKGQDGGLELQDVLAGLELGVAPSSPPPVPGKRPGGGMNDRQRAENLCAMYKEYGIHGFIRQEATYELMFCDFQKDVVPIASTNITLPSTDSFPHPPKDPSSDQLTRGPPKGGPSGAINFAAAQNHYSFARAASWHHIIADTRITLFPQYTITLYDSKYVSIRNTAAESVFDQRLKDLSEDDLTEFKAEIIRSLHSWEKGQFSGSDWRSIFAAAADRYDTSLAEIRAELDAFDPDSTVTRLAERVRAVTYGMLMPYLDAMTTLNETAMEDPDYKTSRLLSLDRSKTKCRGAFTSHLAGLNEQEIRLRDSLEVVLGRICSCVVDMFEKAMAVETVRPEDAVEWREEITDLMDWLDWPSWVRPQRLCRTTEIPYVEMWPLGFSPQLKKGPNLTCVDFSF